MGAKQSLVQAARNNDGVAIKQIFKAGRESAQETRDNALFTAVECGSREAAEALIMHGARVNNEPNNPRENALMIAAILNKISVMELLFENGADVEDQDCDGETALFFAVLGNRMEAVKQLLDKDPYIEHKNKMGETVLMVAAREGFSNIMRLLIAHGATVDMTDKTEGVALMHAAVNDELEAARILIEKNADIRQE